MDDADWEWDEARRICLRMAYRYAGERGEAEDVAQEALLRAWRRRATLRDAGRRNQWLATIVRNEAFRQRARPRPEPRAALEPIEGVEDERVEATVERADLQAALLRLPPCDRVLLTMRYGQDLPQPTIARRLGINENAVRARLHRARDRLRRAYVA